MAKHRSPNYPQVPLAEACERARKVYKSEHTHTAAREVVAKSLGYSSMNGAALAAVSTLRQYGLLESADEGLRVSDDAVSIFELADGDTERSAALRRLAFNPPLFSELNEKFGGKLPSDVHLRHHLIKEKRFLPNAADQVIRVYRANLELVGSKEPGYNGEALLNPTEKEGQLSMQAVAQSSSEKQVASPPIESFTKLDIPEDSSVLAFRISRDSEAKVVFSGQVTQEAIEKLIVLLETSKDTYPTKAELDESEAQMDNAI